MATGAGAANRSIREDVIIEEDEGAGDEDVFRTHGDGSNPRDRLRSDFEPPAGRRSYGKRPTVSYPEPPRPTSQVRSYLSFSTAISFDDPEYMEERCSLGLQGVEMSSEDETGDQLLTSIGRFLAEACRMNEKLIDEILKGIVSHRREGNTSQSVVVVRFANIADRDSVIRTSGIVSDINKEKRLEKGHKLRIIARYCSALTSTKDRLSRIVQKIIDMKVYRAQLRYTKDETEPVAVFVKPEGVKGPNGAWREQEYYYFANGKKGFPVCCWHD